MVNEDVGGEDGLAEEEDEDGDDDEDEEILDFLSSVPVSSSVSLPSRSSPLCLFVALFEWLGLF